MAKTDPAILMILSSPSVVCHSTAQVIGVEQAMERVRELQKLGPPRPVKGERARSKRRFPAVAIVGGLRPLLTVSDIQQDFSTQRASTD